MRISDWSSDVCSSDLYDPIQIGHDVPKWRDYTEANGWQATFLNQHDLYGLIEHFGGDAAFEKQLDALFNGPSTLPRSEEHTSEHQSLMRTSYAVFCLNKTTIPTSA